MFLKRFEIAPIQVFPVLVSDLGCCCLPHVTPGSQSPNQSLLVDTLIPTVIIGRLLAELHHYPGDPAAMGNGMFVGLDMGAQATVPWEMVFKCKQQALGS